MKNKNCFILNLSLSLLTGCAAYQIPPLTIEHPAHPEAEVGPARPITKTLAYASSDVPLALPSTSGPAREKGHESPHEMEVQAQQTASVREKSLQLCQMPINSSLSTAKSRGSWTR
jgi:hypothetical protein